MKTLLIATHNQGKVVEFGQMLEGLNIELKSAADFDLAEPEETENTFTGNALLKARAACKTTGLPSLADDSGLCVDALDGAPGIYSARWGETPNGRDFNMAMQRVHDELKGIDGTQTAHFIAVLALVYPDGQGNIKQEVFEGKFEGHLCWPMRGEKGHGYDPIFIPEGYDMTCAEMEPTQKNKISHRAIAVEKFKNYFLDT
jgi:XTP/dITP diphosphohydrolase